jgi:Calcineurin-like phosphoesterase
MRSIIPQQQTASNRSRLICMAVPGPHGAGGGPPGGTGNCEPAVTRLADFLLGIVVKPAQALVGEVSKSNGVGGEDENSVVSGVTPELKLRHPAAERVVAIGDVHGDMSQFKRALVAAGVIDKAGDWAGGNTVLVQVGDQTDRGDDERQIYETLFRLQDSAPSAGGAVHILVGNHELLQLQLSFRYVTEGGFQDFEKGGEMQYAPGLKPARIPPQVKAVIKQMPAKMQARARACCPGGPLAVELARRAQVAVIVGDNVFVHGGLAPRHLTYGGKPASAALKTLDSINTQCRDYMLGIANQPQVLRGGSSPVWMRDYSRPNVRPGSEECRMLAETLKMLNVKRMIVGHTPQEEGINAACSGRVWRIDTGMSAVYGGVPEAIEISKRGRIRILNPDVVGAIEGSARARGR